MKRALIVGINEYEKIDPLRGCVNDAIKVEAVISKQSDGSRNFDSKLVTSDGGKHITRKDLKAMLGDLLEKPADMAFFYFSGHGTATNLGGYLCTFEADRYDEGYSMQDLLTLINSSPVKEIIVILDCCQSGALGSIPSLGSTGHSIIKEGVSILTASRDSESAIEVNGSGVFTSLVVDALNGSAADLLGTVTPAGIYSHVEQSFGAWDQRPLFKSYVSRSTPLRKTAPKVDPILIRKIPDFFLNQNTPHRLDPSYEFTHKMAKAENVEKFKALKKLQTAGLIRVNREPDPDLYWACLENKSCDLTPLGQFYWHLVKAGKI